MTEKESATMQMLDKATLLAKTETTIRLPMASQAAEQDVAVRVRRIGGYEYRSLLPPAPPGIETWTKDEMIDKELAWMASLPVAERVERRAEMLGAMYAAISLACLEPVMSATEARRLGDDALVLFNELMKFSGLAGGAEAVAETKGGSDKKPATKGAAPAA